MNPRLLKSLSIVLFCMIVISILAAGCFGDNTSGNDSGKLDGGVQEMATMKISIDTAKGYALSEGFSGFNVRPVDQGWNYTNPEFKKGVETMKPGWLRFFSGTVNDTFNWKTGLYEMEWVAQLGEVDLSKVAGRVSIKGPQKLSEYYKELLGPVGGKVIIDVNAFTDSPESAGDMAMFCKDNNILVEAYQLCNEPYFFIPSRKKVNFNNGLDYAKKMKPYADAIKAADPNAKIALSYSWDTESSFRKEIAEYKSPYWDIVSIHSYATYGKEETWDVAQKKVNGGLIYATSREAMKDHESISWKGSPIIVTEYNVYNNALSSTLLNGIYVAEYAMRMSSHPNVKYVGLHSISTAAFGPENSHAAEMDAAYNAGKTLDTNKLTYGLKFYIPGLAMQIVNEAINNSTYAWETVIEGGTEVEAFKRDLRQKFDTKKTVKVPGLFAWSYRGDNGRNYVLVSNRSSEPQKAQIILDGKSLKAEVTKTYIASSNPKSDKGIEIKSETAQVSENNPVTIPGYSVVRLEWDSGKTLKLQPTRIYDAQAADGQVTLKWWKRNSVSGNTAGYEILYGTSKGNYTGSIKVNSDTTGYTVPGLADGSTYYFAVKAFNSAGESEHSNVVELKIAKPQIPEITAARPEDGKITLEWRSVPGAAGYRVYYGSEKGSREKSIDAGNVSGVVINGLENEKTFYFALAAYNGKGESAVTETFSTPKENLPYAPQEVSTKSGPDNKAVLTWKPSKNITETYEIKRSLQPASGYVTIASDVTGTSFTDKLPEEGEYYYIITAKNENGTSNYHSSPASVIAGAKANTNKKQEPEEEIEAQE